MTSLAELLNGLSQPCVARWGLFISFAALPTILQSCQQRKRISSPQKQSCSATSVYDCIIVGAGVSGLRVAKDLVKKHGVDPNKILILEAEDYIGGRIKQDTTFVPNGMIELGAEILHGEKTLLTEFGAEQGENIVPIYCWAHGDGGPMEHPVRGTYGMYYFSDSERLLRFDSEEADFERMNDVLWGLSSLAEKDYTPSTSLDEYLRSQQFSPEMLSMANAGYANTLCNRSDVLSLQQVIRWGKQWDTEGENEGDFKYERTFRCLIDYLKDGANVQLSTPVRRIRLIDADTNSVVSMANDFAHNPSAPRPRLLVELETRHGAVLRAKSCVVTSSLHVLQQAVAPAVPDTDRYVQLRFEPQLPARLQRALQLDQAILQPAMKVFVRFSARAWPAGLQGMIFAPPTQPGPALDEAQEGFFPEIWFGTVPRSAQVGAAEEKGAPGRGRHPAHDSADYSFYATGFATSDFARGLIVDKKTGKHRTDDEICLILARQLERAFGKLRKDHWLSYSKNSTVDTLPEPLPNARKVVSLPGRVQRWTPDYAPYVGGGYASGLARTSQDEFNYAQVLGSAQVEGVLFFAGEHANFPAGATAHAALESAVRAAKAVAAVL